MSYYFTVEYNACTIKRFQAIHSRAHGKNYCTSKIFLDVVVVTVVAVVAVAVYYYNYITLNNKNDNYYY